jgi:hypothetical protein
MIKDFIIIIGTVVILTSIAVGIGYMFTDTEYRQQLSTVNEDCR